MCSMSSGRVMKWVLPLVGMGIAVVGMAGPLDAPSKEAVAEGRRIVESMKAGERGPFARLRWFCNDGSVHPPQPYPCEALGGGVQHGEYSADRQRLADLGWHVGTVLIATPFDELWSSQPRQQRLRELVIERWLMAEDDGWVMRRARVYRGALQVEDEEKAGRDILLKALDDGTFRRENFLLARELVRFTPHAGQGGDRTRTVRTTSKEISDLDKSFEPVRIRIHNAPSASDADATRTWATRAESEGKDAALVARARQLATDIDALYGEKGRTDRLVAAAAKLSRTDDADLAEVMSSAINSGARRRATVLSGLTRTIRERIEDDGNAARRLALVDLSLDVEAEALASLLAAAREPGITRSDLANLARAGLNGAHGSGLLSTAERDALSVPIGELVRDGAASAISTADWLRATRALERASSWGVGAVKHQFGEPLASYTALEPVVARFPDDVLRGSPLLALADIASRLARDAEQQSGLAHSIFGAEQGGLAGLNPGVAMGPLKVVSEEALLSGELPQDAIVVLPSTASDLPPVAGILTISEGNALSHVQMLARNLGIPNAVVPPLLLDSLRRHDGERVLLSVAGSGSVVLASETSVPAALRESITGEKARAAAANKVTAPVPDLTARKVLTLDELRATLSGKLVGPKAANVGELAHHFPGRVAPALALPFGFYAQHAATGAGSPKARLDDAFARYRAGTLDEAGLNAEVDAVGAQVEALKILPVARRELEKLMLTSFGEPGTYGVFVRSDTNVEDLPQFTGAGLNKTIPHVVGMDAVMDAIPKVWASPFARRAMAWRAQALLDPEEVYPSVLLMKSVPSTKSGVLVTRDVATGGEGVTISVSWGVGGAVDGESAETLVLRPDGSATIVSEAKAPYQRSLAPEGGVKWIPAPAGRVLTDDDIAQLRAFVPELLSKLEPTMGDDGKPMPWDVELGFVQGKLVLFQVRPLVERGAALADRVVVSLIPSRAVPVAKVDLAKPPQGPAAAFAGGTREAQQ